MKTTRRDILMMCGAAGTVVAGVAPASAGPDWDGYPRIMQGPRVGWTGPDVAMIWLRFSGNYEAILEYGIDPSLRSARRSAPVQAKAETDFTVRLAAEGLQPGQTIYYRVLIDGAPTIVDRGRRRWKTRAAPSADDRGRFRIAFGSCARYAVSPDQPVWDGVEKADPDLFLWLGDNIYGDNTSAEGLREEYRRQLSVTNLEPIQSRVPQLAIWDDHDFALNDSDRRNPVKKEALSAFRDYWANPSYGLPSAPGVFFRHSFGQVDLFMLDNRYDRSPAGDPDGPDKTALGKVQLQWLMDELQSSTAPFKVIASGQGWTDAKAFGGESWASYLHERNMILDFIRQNAIRGVILISGDTHVAEMNVLPGGADGYDIVECVSSPLAQETAMSWLNYKPVPRLRQVYAGGVNFGLLDFDFTSDDPTVRLDIRNAQGDSVWDPVDLAASDLQPGRSFWRARMDKVSARRWQRFETTGVYYG
ncbi:alkaline phosphatase D family protein [Hyphomonas sp.]|uniref:alkaline phosphatase D family protein n=1 Tax=Hyphomonas sp. TaxID=87 RepID=UPI0030F4D188